MIRVNINELVTNFKNRIKDARLRGLSEIKVSVDELDDISYVLYILMSEKIDKMISSLQLDKNMEDKTPIFDNSVSNETVKSLIKKRNEAIESNTTVDEIKPEVREYKKKDEKIEIKIDDEEDDGYYTMDGGSW